MQKRFVGCDVPAAIFNLKQKHDGEQRLWCTYDIKDIAYLYPYYDFVSRADALACKEQLEQLKQSISEKKYYDELLMDNIERALGDVEDQIKGFDELSR